MNQQYFIGIDGGGTKTTGVIGDENGNLLASVQGKSSNIRSKPIERVVEVLIEVIRGLINQAGVNGEEVETIYLALAGSDLAEAREAIRNCLYSSLDQNIRLVIDNDAMAALASGTWGEAGVVLIAGTGSIALGWDGKEKVVRVGGWGYVLGDEGSGFDIGRKGLVSVLRAFDGRGESTLLTEMAVQAFQINLPEDLIPAIYGRDEWRGRIASFAESVLIAAKQGDPIAMEIVHHAIFSLVELVSVLRSKMSLRQLVLSGGLFRDSFFKDKFTEAAKDIFEIHHPHASPAVGAFLLAIRSSGYKVTNEMKSRLKERRNSS